MDLNIVLGLIVGIIIGALAAFLLDGRLIRVRVRSVEGQLVHAQKQAIDERNERERLAIENASLQTSVTRLPGLEKAVSDLRLQLENANSRLSETRTLLETERKAFSARVEELNKMGAEIERKFTLLASEALGRNSENFLKLVSERFEAHKVVANADLEKRQKAIEVLVRPITEGLIKFEHQVGELEKSRQGAYGAITEQVKSLAEGQIGLRTETSRLVQALRKPQTRGRWGEYQLRNVLEMTGMTEHVDFIEQPTIQTEIGQLRPDVVVRLPGGKSVVVDAKTPLDAYLSALETDDEAIRQELLTNHANQIRNHVRVLGSREYWKALPVTPDFVVMFVPGEAFFSAAIESDPGLFEQAVRHRVLISTPTTFIALVKAIAYGWQQNKLAENAHMVVGLARDLFDRIKTFGGHMSELGRSLTQAVHRYNRSVGSLEGRVLPAARKFETLGVAPIGEALPQLDPIETEARELQAAELTVYAASGSLGEDDRPTEGPMA